MATRRDRWRAERLPLDDPGAAALPDELREGIARHWLRRARSEKRIGLAFASMAPRLVGVGAHSEVTALAELAAEDEARHADICLALAAHYAGTPVANLDVGEVCLPTFGCADERLEMALVVAGTCCINETLATAWIEAAVNVSQTPLTVAANRAHLREEIDHARLGWAHLASAAVADLREALGACLVRLLEANVPLWERADAFVPGEGVAGHGLPSTEAARAAIGRALDEVVLPGFAYVGVDIGEARRWLAAR